VLRVSVELAAKQRVPVTSEYSTAERLQLVSNGKGRHKSWLQQWLQSWSSSLQRKRIDSIVVSYKVYTL
jgi:hypothetical protein